MCVVAGSPRLDFNSSADNDRRIRVVTEYISGTRDLYRQTEDDQPTDDGILTNERGFDKSEVFAPSAH